MMEINIEIIGLIAAVFTTSSFFPQVIKIWRTKQTKDISTSNVYCNDDRDLLLASLWNTNK